MLGVRAGPASQDQHVAAFCASWRPSHRSSLTGCGRSSHRPLFPLRAQPSSSSSPATARRCVSPRLSTTRCLRRLQCTTTAAVSVCPRTVHIMMAALLAVRQAWGRDLEHFHARAPWHRLPPEPFAVRSAVSAPADVSSLAFRLLTLVLLAVFAQTTSRLARPAVRCSAHLTCQSLTSATPISCGRFRSRLLRNRACRSDEPACWSMHSHERVCRWS